MSLPFGATVSQRGSLKSVANTLILNPAGTVGKNPFGGFDSSGGFPADFVANGAGSCGFSPCVTCPSKTPGAAHRIPNAAIRNPHRPPVASIKNLLRKISRSPVKIELKSPQKFRYCLTTFLPRFTTTVSPPKCRPLRSSNGSLGSNPGLPLPNLRRTTILGVSRLLGAAPLGLKGCGFRLNASQIDPNLSTLTVLVLPGSLVLPTNAVNASPNPSRAPPLSHHVPRPHPKLSLDNMSIP